MKWNPVLIACAAHNVLSGLAGMQDEWEAENRTRTREREREKEREREREKTGDDSRK